MTFSERMKELFDQGVAATKDFAVKAGAKAQDLGERGVLMFEIKQLEGKAQKLLGKLGSEVYRAFAERDQKKVEQDADEIQPLIKEISAVRDLIELKENDLRSRRN